MAEGTSRRLLVALALSSALAPLNSTMLAVALPAIGRAFGHAVPTLTHALVTSYLVASITLQSAGGALGDRVGHRRALAWGQWVFLAGSVLGALAPELGTLVLSRVLMAAGGAVIVPSATATLRNELPPDRRGRAFGAFGAVMGIAAMLGPLVGGALESRFGFRAVFVANVPVLVIAALLAGRASPAAAPAARKALGLDLVGTGLFACALGALVVGARLPGPARLVVLAFAVAAFIPFALRNRNVPEPTVDLALLRIPALLAGGLVVALHNMGMYALLFLLPATLEGLFHLDSSQTARTVVSMMVAMVVVSPIAGRLSDRIGTRTLAVAGSAVAWLGMLLIRLSPLESAGGLLLPLVLMGAGIGLATPPAQTAAMSAAPRERSGKAAGLLSTLRYLGGVAGILVLGFIARTGNEHAAIVRELHRASEVFLVALGLAAIAAASLKGDEPRRALPERKA